MAEFDRIRVGIEGPAEQIHKLVELLELIPGVASVVFTPEPDEVEVGIDRWCQASDGPDHCVRPAEHDSPHLAEGGRQWESVTSFRVAGGTDG